MSRRLACDEVEERLGDYVDGELDEASRAEVDAHLGACDACRPLSEAMREVVAALRSIPVLEPSPGLAARAAEAALRLAPRRALVAARLRLSPPAWLLATAAGVALALTAGVLMVSGNARGAGRLRVAERTGNAAAYLAERKDRLVEDIHILRVVIGTAFEARLDRMNDRVDDYRRLLEKRRAADAVRKTQGFLQNNGAGLLVTVVDDDGAAAGSPL